MATVPLWLTAGNGPFTCAIVPQTVDAAGLLSDGTSVPLAGVLDDISWGNNPTLENIRPMSIKRANNVLIEDNPSLTLVEILKSAGVNILAAQNYAAGIFKVIFVRGAQTVTYYGTRGAYSEQVKNGKSTASLTLESVETGAPNPTYA